MLLNTLIRMHTLLLCFSFSLFLSVCVIYKQAQVHSAAQKNKRSFGWIKNVAVKLFRHDTREVNKPYTTIFVTVCVCRIVAQKVVCDGLKWEITHFRMQCLLLLLSLYSSAHMSCCCTLVIVFAFIICCWCCLVLLGVYYET